MPTNPHYGNGPLTISHSSRGTLQSCPRKFELRKVYGHARNEREDSIATGSGTALHTGWQTWMATRDKQAATVAFMLAYPAHLQRSANHERSLEACYSTLLEMIAHPIDSRYVLATVEHNGVAKPAVEVPFRIQFPGFSLYPDVETPVHYIGFIDAILYDTLRDRYIVADVKTTRKYRNDYTAMFARDSQCLPYSYVLQKALNQPADALDVLYFVAYVDAMNPRVLTYEFPKSAATIQAWAFDFAFELSNLRQYAALGFFPRRGAACDTYGVCEYDPFCDSADPHTLRQSLDYYFGKPEPANLDDAWIVVNLTIEGLA